MYNHISLYQSQHREKGKCCKCRVTKTNQKKKRKKAKKTKILLWKNLPERKLLQIHINLGKQRRYCYAQFTDEETEN